ncbi:pathway-specific nitrogen regulator [Phlyctema vagabunda]|uniref:Pathway-specific nitrogen regulator n=1 Tax=Phlyctema vagabunda TaxID=108571 RepID=A0ABR4PMW0_9HELO
MTMGKKSAAAKNFKIHVDPSCLSDDMDFEMPAERVTSNETVVHHEPEPPSDHVDEQTEQTEPRDELQELLDELSQHGSSGGEELEEPTEEKEEVEPAVVEEAQPSQEEHDSKVEEVEPAVVEEAQPSQEEHDSKVEDVESEEIQAAEPPSTENLQSTEDVHVEEDLQSKSEPESEEELLNEEAPDSIEELQASDDLQTPEHVQSSEDSEINEVSHIEDAPESSEESQSADESANDDTVSRKEELGTTEELQESEEPQASEELLIDEEAREAQDPVHTEDPEILEVPQDDEEPSVDQDTQDTEDLQDDGLHSDGEEEHHENEQEQHEHEQESLHDEDEDSSRRREEQERREERAEALIQAAARAVVASIEQDHYDHYNEDSVLSTQTDESYDQSASELTYDEGTELTNGEEGTDLKYDEAETPYESETEHHASENGAGDSSSHHDGDIDDDDVFSHDSGRSARSSLNSSDALHSGEEAYQEKVLTSPKVGEEAAPSEAMSRIPSAASFRETTPQTPGPSKVLSRPPFRTPSAVRAMQMSSPTPSLYASPRSTKRVNQNFNPTVSRLGTPSRRNSELSQSHFSSSSRHKTPTRVFKSKIENPLVLLHVTVLPLQFPYADVMNLSEEEIPGVLFNLKESWRLLQDKCGEQVLARGILLPHPQDSYEVLEERLLEALELPVRPRAKILKCGHYMGPDELTSSADESSDDRDDDWVIERRDSKAWCDLCSRNVQFDKGEFGATERKFRVKIYASNGLMRAGAWAAAWREMERVDVEIEPFVESHLLPELEHLQSEQLSSPEEEEYVEEEDHEPHETHEEKVLREHHAAEAEEALRKQAVEDEEARQQAEATQQEDEARRQEEERRQEKVRRQEAELEHMRQIYEAASTRPASQSAPRRESRRRSRSPHHGESLPELLLAAFKVAMRDQKNILICVLSIVVLVLALRPRGGETPQPQSVHTRAPEQVFEAVQHRMPEAMPRRSRMVAEVPAKIEEVLDELEVVPRAKRTMEKAEAPVKPLRKVAEIPGKLEEYVEEMEVVPKMNRATRNAEACAKPLRTAAKAPENVEETAEETEVVPKIKRTVKSAGVPAPVKSKSKPVVKQIEEPAPVEVEFEEVMEEVAARDAIESCGSAAIEEADVLTSTYGMEVPEPLDSDLIEGEEDVQPVDQEHYHIEPPTQKKKKAATAPVKRAAETGVEPAQRGVERVVGSGGGRRTQ